jgi:uncharacterized membrane protein YdjX (TVP38/TMEM64 family)
MDTDGQPAAVALGHRYRLGQWMRAARRAAAAAVLLGVAAAVALGPGPGAAWDAVRENLESWQAWVGRNPVPALLGFFLAVAVATSLPLPVLTLTSLLAGALFGTTLGALVTSLAYTTGVTVSFLVARWLLRDRVQRMVGGWLRRVERGVARDGALYLLTLRLVPSVPFFLVNVLMALTPIRTRTYVVVSWVGSLPLAFLCAAVGTGLASLESPADALSPRAVGALVALAALATLPLLVRKLVRVLRPAAEPAQP